MKNFFKIKNKYLSILFLFFFFCILQNLKIFNNYLDNFFKFYFFLFIFYLIFLFFKQKLDLTKTIDFFISNSILIVIIFIIFIEYFFSGIFFDLKILLYLLLCIFLSYLNHEIREKSFIKLLIFSSIIFLIIGTYGWVNGGESDAWGKSYVYFAYNYLPSTRNEDIFVFFLGFISSLYFLFSYKFNFIIIIINQINLQALILSFSRGYYLLILINLITYLIYIAIYKKK